MSLLNMAMPISNPFISHLSNEYRSLTCLGKKRFEDFSSKLFETKLPQRYGRSHISLSPWKRLNTAIKSMRRSACLKRTVERREAKWKEEREMDGEKLERAETRFLAAVYFNFASAPAIPLFCPKVPLSFLVVFLSANRWRSNCTTIYCRR